DLFQSVRGRTRPTLFPYTTLFRSESPGLIVVSDTRGSVTGVDTTSGRTLWTWEGTEERESCAGTQEPTRQPVASDLDPTYLVCRSEEHTSELQSRENLVCRLLLEK